MQGIGEYVIQNVHKFIKVSRSKISWSGGKTLFENIKNTLQKIWPELFLVKRLGNFGKSIHKGLYDLNISRHNVSVLRLVSGLGMGSVSVL